MSIEKLIEMQTINFPREISLEESEKLLEYVATNLPAEISLNASYYKNISLEREDDGSLSEDIKTKTYEGHIKLSANVVGYKSETPNNDTPKFHTSDTLQFHTSNTGELNKFIHMKFIHTQGYKEFDYHEDVKELWGQVREVSDAYFKDNPFYSEID